MRNCTQKLLALAALSALAIASGCTGFFVNPTLSSLTIGPQTQTITSNPVQTLQMSATGTFSDGSTQDLTGKVSWSSDTPTCATINSAGLVTPVKSVSGICTTNISAASGTVPAATTTVTVTEGMPTSIQLSVAPTMNPAAGTALTFTAKALFPGSSALQDITSSVTWIDSDPTNVPLTQGSGASDIPQTAQAESVTVQASFDNVNSNQITITIQ
jgi:Bacterial Ig-like domain (group 2)